MPDFAAAASPEHRFRCHHPVEENQSTRDLVAQAGSASQAPSPATALADIPTQHHP
jgi:peptide/nickel transport system ATP-binding protein